MNTNQPTNPPNAESVLKRFRKAPLHGDMDPRLEPKGNQSSWNQPRKLYEVAVKDKDEDSLKRLFLATHNLHTSNYILNTENDGLRDALAHTRKHTKKRASSNSPPTPTSWLSLRLHFMPLPQPSRPLGLPQATATDSLALIFILMQ